MDEKAQREKNGENMGVKKRMRRNRGYKRKTEGVRLGEENRKEYTD